MVNQYGIMIGGTPEPDDIVGMHIIMPTAPGIGVSVNINPVNDVLNEIYSQIPADNPKAESLKLMIKGAILEQQADLKIKIIKEIIIYGAGIAQIATSIYSLKSLIGF